MLNPGVPKCDEDLITLDIYVYILVHIYPLLHINLHVHVKHGSNLIRIINNKFHCFRGHGGPLQKNPDVPWAPKCRQM